MELAVLAAAGGSMFVILGGMMLLLWKCYVRVPVGKALVISTSHGDFVRKNGGIVLPIVNQAEVIDLKVTPIRIERRSENALLTSDNARAEIGVTFLIRVNDTTEDILKAAKSVGCARATDVAALTELLGPKFTQAMVIVVCHFTFDQLTTKRDELQDKLLEVIGRDLNGLVLDDVAIDLVERATTDHAGPFR